MHRASSNVIFYQFCFGQLQQMFPVCASNFTTVGLAAEMAGPSYLQYNTVQQAITGGLDLGINTSDMTLKRTISASISHPEAIVDSSCFNVISYTLVSLTSTIILDVSVF